MRYMSFLDMTLTAGKISLGFGWKHGSHFSRILLSKFWACWGSGCCLQRFRRVPDRPEEPQGRSWLWILVCTFVTWWLPPFCLTLLYHVHDKFAITCPTLWYHYTGRWIPSTVRQPHINFAWVGTAMPCLPSMFSVSSFITFLWKPIDSGEYKEYNYDRKNKNGQNVLGVITWRLQNRKMKWSARIY